ncbi:MAG: glycosyltransferase family 2 protein [Bacteroidales bacterium]
METIFWILLIVIVYSYLGYPLLLIIVNFLQRWVKPKRKVEISTNLPDVTMLIAAYNEIEFIEQKVNNTLSLNYPKENLYQIWITDGSDDGTYEKLKKYNELKVYHQKERKGKTGAINRGMQYVKTPIVIFSDANAMLNKDAVKKIINEFNDPKVGCVAGEKRIQSKNKTSAVNAGEGIYWKYESIIKTCESNLNSALGAAGELFGIRKELFYPIEKDTILDDFTISMQIAEKDYKIAYSPGAYATEEASININEEFKRKIRIAYGGFQSLFRHTSLLNIFKHPLLTFQYISHKVLRWLVIPFALIAIFIINLALLFKTQPLSIYFYLFFVQLFFYFTAILGAFFQTKNIKFTIFFAPYYLVIMNLSVIMGFIRFLKKRQSVNWERAKRK